MRPSIIITSRVIDTINSLSNIDRGPITNALSMEFILGQDPGPTLTPMQNVVYAIIRFYVNQDTERGITDRASTAISLDPNRRALS